jgi:hypothetical protein
MAMYVALGRDLGQWSNRDAAERFWFQQLMQPDTYPEPKSCCGESDAYWADVVHVEGGKTIATITDERDDDPLRRIHEEPGTRYIIPPNKIVDKPGNPTGHIVIFLGGITWDHTANRTRAVLCFVLNGGV